MNNENEILDLCYACGEENHLMKDCARKICRRISDLEFRLKIQQNLMEFHRTELMKFIFNKE